MGKILNSLQLALKNMPLTLKNPNNSALTVPWHLIEGRVGGQELLELSTVIPLSGTGAETKRQYLNTSASTSEAVLKPTSHCCFAFSCRGNSFPAL